MKTARSILARNMARHALRMLLPAAALAALLSGGAYAQNPLMPSISLGGPEKRKLSPEEQQKQDELDNAYKAATTKIPDQKPANDPWAAVRPSTPAPAAKKKQP